MAMFLNNRYIGHICGCYYQVQNNRERNYLPQVELSSHTVINPVCFTTALTQTFNNPKDEAISQLRYSFPLYDGVAVCEYRIQYGEKTLTGVVKQKEEAKQIYDTAISRGETAGFLESLPAGVYGVTIGNVPPKTDVIVEIKYCGELKHDASIDGLRYNLPTAIAPRYGCYPGKVLESTTSARGIKISVDIDMGKSAIRKAQSPTHPIAVSMGGSDRNFNPAIASASLALPLAELDSDFVLQLLVDDINKPQATQEIHTTLPNQRAIMTTLVPRFALKDETHHPEVVFIADQSGSMSGSKNDALVKAIRIFLKSLPTGVRFNVVAFGSGFKFLWPKSAAYNQANLEKALDFVNGFSASYGGTEILQPIQQAFKSRLGDMPLEVMLLTDGEVWGEDAIFNYINEQIHEKAVDARIFALGIGGDVSHTLVEGVARAGSGFAQFVTQNEQTDEKVIRMLKAALYPHTKDYSIEVNYSDYVDDNDDVDDFELIEKVNDCLQIRDTVNSSPPPEYEPKTAGSFFDESMDLDKPKEKKATGRYDHLPTINTPKLLQAPHTIPPLYPFNRTTLYLLLGPESSQKRAASITIRATAAQGPLELKVPITMIKEGTSIHKLAARKAVQDLEEGRGWLTSATSGSGGKSIKQQHSSRFDEIVEREAVKLGERFQVAGKWCAFVAVGDSPQPSSQSITPAPSITSYDSTGYDPTIEDMDEDRQQLAASSPRSRRFFGAPLARKSSVPGAAPRKQLASMACRKAPAPQAYQAQQAPQAQQAQAPPAAKKRLSRGMGLFGAASRDRAQTGQAEGGGTFSSFRVDPTVRLEALADDEMASSDGATLMGKDETGGTGALALSDFQMQLMLLEQQNKKRSLMARSAPVPPVPPKSPDDIMRELIDEQQFSGAWIASPSLFTRLGVDSEEMVKTYLNIADSSCIATLLVLAYFEMKLGHKKDVWELVARKALHWIHSQNLSESSDELVRKAKSCLN